MSKKSKRKQLPAKTQPLDVSPIPLEGKTRWVIELRDNWSKTNCWWHGHLQWISLNQHGGYCWTLGEIGPYISFTKREDAENFIKFIIKCTNVPRYDLRSNEVYCDHNRLMAWLRRTIIKSIWLFTLPRKKQQ